MRVAAAGVAGGAFVQNRACISKRACISQRACISEQVGFVLRRALARAAVCAGKEKAAQRVSHMLMFALVGCLCAHDVWATVPTATATCSRSPCKLRFFANVATLCSFLENVPLVFDAFGSSSPSARCFVSCCFPDVLCLVLCLEAGPPAAFALGCWPTSSCVENPVRAPGARVSPVCRAADV